MEKGHGRIKFLHLKTVYLSAVGGINIRDMNNF